LHPFAKEILRMISRFFHIVALTVLLTAGNALALDRPGTVFKIFQFPPNMIPRIDGDASDWAIVPDDYAIGMDQLVDDSKHFAKPDPSELNATVRVGWVKGMNRLYFLYQAYKRYWDFSQPGLHNDIFEVVVDAERGGGPFIGEQQDEKDVRDPNELYYDFQNRRAQNYHVFTPAMDKDWCMVWGPQQWLKELPYSNAACNYNFKPGESGKLTLEFWITPFAYASPEGPKASVESELTENKIIGLSYAILDYGNVNAKQQQFEAFWNLSRHHTSYGNASQLVAFKLMPLEDKFKKPIDAAWSCTVLDMDRRLVAFKDESPEKSLNSITSWTWDFGDGSTSTEENPIHAYTKGGRFTVTLVVGGPVGQSKLSKVWGVVVK
jgi:hypothetical protein